MSKKKKIIITVILIIIFALCFIPNQNYNCRHRLEIVSSYGDNQAYHPKVLAFKEKWNGYKYWMSYTPYPKGDDGKENPHIAVSNDLINWKTPGNNVNPLDEPDDKQASLRYNSDSHIVYNYDTNELYCYWRYVDDINNAVFIYRRDTKDGINWTPKKITAYSNDRKSKDYISPAIIYENGAYKMWYVDQGNIVTYATSNDGITWNDENIIELEYEKNLKTWHLDVIHTRENYEMIVVAYDKWSNRNDMNLYYTSSTNGIIWDKTRTILKPSVRSQYWDNKGIYRSSFIYENGKYYVFYGGTSKSYDHGIGMVYGESIDNLHKVNANFKSQKDINRLKEQISR